MAGETYDDQFPSLVAKPVHSEKLATINSGNPPLLGRGPKMYGHSLVTKTLCIPRSECRSYDGTFLLTSQYTNDVKTIMDKTFTSIEMSTSSKDKSLSIIIRGKAADAEAAKVKLLALFQIPVMMSVAVPREHHGSIVGKGGQRILSLEQATGTRIKMPAATDPEQLISISGSISGVNEAVKRIKQLSIEQAKTLTEIISIPRRYHPFLQTPSPTADLIRRNPATGQVFSVSDVKINIPPVAAEKDEVTVKGERDAVTVVTRHIKTLLSDMKNNYGEVSLDVPKHQHRFVIGPRGSGINDVLATYGVHVEIPAVDSDSSMVTLFGPKASIGLAVSKVYEKANSIVLYEISCPSWLFKYLIGRKGAGLAKYSDNTQIHIKFNESTNSITVEGPPLSITGQAGGSADEVRDDLQKQVDELQQTMVCRDVFARISGAVNDKQTRDKIISVLNVKYKYIVNKIRRTYDVTINLGSVESHGAGPEKAVIEGKHDQVESAHKELTEFIKKVEFEREKDLVIESRFHSMLIGSKGESIKKVHSEHPGVSIAFPEAGNVSDVVKLCGPPDEIEKVAKVLLKQYKALQESNFQQKIQMSHETRSRLHSTGELGRLRQMFEDVKFSFGNPKQMGSTENVKSANIATIVITGVQGQVMKAAKKVSDFIKAMASYSESSIPLKSAVRKSPLFPSVVRLIKSVADEYGGLVKITIPSASDGDDAKIQIQGPSADVERARIEVTDLIGEKIENLTTTEVRVDAKFHRFLIGKNGSNITAMREKTGASFFFPDAGSTEDCDKITVIGTANAVAEAVSDLNARVDELKDAVEERIEVPAEYHKVFVARRGELINSISDQCGNVVVSFPRQGTESNEVVIKGGRDCVQSAIEKIQQVVDQMQRQTEVEVSIDPCHHGALVGRGGSRIQQLCSEYDVEIRLPDKRQVHQGQLVATSASEDANVDSNNNSVDANRIPPIVIRGEVDACAKAKQALLELVPISRTIHVPMEMHRFLVGAQGRGIKQLMTEYDMMAIRVPKAGENSDKIELEGTRANVDEVEVVIMNRVDKWHEEKADRVAKAFELKFEVDKFYHPKIIGRAGSVISKLRKDHDVQIVLPNATDEAADSQITVIGYEANAIAAKDAILQIVKDIDALCHEDIVVSPQYHSMIIGRRGQGIVKLLTKYGVDIKLPRRDDERNDVITITGTEDGVQDCKDHILNMVEEMELIDSERNWEREFVRSKDGDESVKKSAPHPTGEKRGESCTASSGSQFFVGSGAPWESANGDLFPNLPTASDQIGQAKSTAAVVANGWTNRSWSNK